MFLISPTHPTFRAELGIARANASVLQLGMERAWLETARAQADVDKAVAASLRAERDAGRYEGVLEATKAQLSSSEKMVAWLKTLLGERLGQRGGGGTAAPPSLLKGTAA